MAFRRHGRRRGLGRSGLAWSGEFQMPVALQQPEAERPAEGQHFVEGSDGHMGRESERWMNAAFSGHSVAGVSTGGSLGSGLL